MIRHVLTFYSFFTVYSAIVLSLVYATNPFESKLPKKIETQQPQDKIIQEEEIDTSVFNSLAIEGLFWDIPVPKVIINGEIYAEGDSLRGFDMKLISVTNKEVKILYKGRIFLLSPEGAMSRLTERR